jgi:hypothetical protein
MALRCHGGKSVSVDMNRVAKVDHYRNRAEQLRQIAGDIHNDEARIMLLEIAIEYEQMGWNTQHDRTFVVPERRGS